MGETDRGAAEGGRADRGAAEGDRGTLGHVYFLRDERNTSFVSAMQERKNAGGGRESCAVIIVDLVEANEARPRAAGADRGAVHPLPDLAVRDGRRGSHRDRLLLTSLARTRFAVQMGWHSATGYLRSKGSRGGRLALNLSAIGDLRWKGGTQPNRDRRVTAEWVMVCCA